MHHVTITWENQNQIKKLIELIRENVGELSNKLHETRKRERLTQQDVDECVRLLTLSSMLLLELHQADSICEADVIPPATGAVQSYSWLALRYLAPRDSRADIGADPEQ
ncbi:hypothetical protein SAMN02927900_06173 [Rhizobium mongolense subsp. loessense]|uniref:Uncharacterized protein n=1 Tax=Rhizobium mongolense subsp. loessense TaxID=158890 RepID=A0A1G4U7J9_9HYPH|nr:hypothetical protein SAMN02927900_06173 [Rhizobium mongolense subsp. loessense]